METAVTVATEDVEGERRTVLWSVFIRHNKLKDATADGLSLL